MAKTPSKSFWFKSHERWECARSLVCLGLDSDLALLPDCLKTADNPIWEFNRRVIDATAELVGAYKPNLAFYLADGTRGLEALQRTLQYIPAEIPTILDCKSGDIGSTMEHYCAAFFDQLGADSITLNPLMGADVLKPVLARQGAFAFALALTSNPSAQDFFLAGGVDEQVAKWITQFPADQLGAVVGATQSADLKRMRELLPGRLFLIPGIGAQGGDLASVLRYAVDSADSPNILINSSRGIIFKDRSTDFARAARHATAELREQILQGLGA